MAIMAGKLRLFQSLLDEGFDPNEIHSGKTPMEMCIALCSSTDSVRLVKSLIKHGANVNLNRPLHAACKRGVPAVVGKLNLFTFLLTRVCLFEQYICSIM